MGEFKTIQAFREANCSDFSRKICMLARITRNNSCFNLLSRCFYCDNILNGRIKILDNTFICFVINTVYRYIILADTKYC